MGCAYLVYCVIGGHALQLELSFKKLKLHVNMEKTERKEACSM